ncbi:MAG: iron-containing alcohol dehydrogenase [Pseudomonadota bacterium]
MNSVTNFTVKSPREVFFGAGRIRGLEELVKPFHRVMLVIDRNIAATSHFATVKSLLGAKLCAVFEDMPSPTDLPAVAAAFEIAGRTKPHVIVSIGGSSTIDGAKAVSRLMDWPMHISIPTTYGGSEVTHVFGTVNPETKVKEVFIGSDCIPTYVIYDPELTITLPPDVTAGSGMNSLAHCIEAFYCSANPINRAFCATGIEWIMKSLPDCVENPADLQARAGMLLGSYAAGTAVCNGFIGLHHGICHFIGPAYGISHGEANSIMLPYVMQYNLDAVPAEMSAVARIMGLDTRGRSDLEAGQMAVEAVVELERKTGVPRHLRDFGVMQDTFADLAEKALNTAAVRNNPKPVNSAQQIIDVLEMAL